jgi:hypothetical protein
MTRSKRTHNVAELVLLGVLGAGLIACTGKIGETSGTGGSGNGSGSGTGGSGSGSGNGGSTSGNGGSGNGSGSGTGGSGNGSGTGSGGSSAVDGGAAPSVGQSNVITCAPGIAATSQIPRMLDAQYDNVISDLLGVTGLTSMSNQPPSSLLSPDSTGSLDTIAWNGYQSAASAIAAQVFASSTLTANFMSCSVTGTATATATCLQNTVQTFGRKAFRRPLTTTEVSNFMVLNSLTPAGTGTQVAQAILTAFLESPSFIMLPELNQTQTNGNYQLNSYEVATRLSFLFLNSVPDATLSTAADNNQLTTKAQILAQAKRLLGLSKASQMANSFAQFYLAIENGSHWTNNTTHDTTKYPAWDSNSYAPAMAEITSFFQNLTLNGGKFSDLFLSNIGYVTKDTAPLYGLTGSTYTSTPMQVTLDSTKRPGFLTRVGFLSTFAHFDVTSPIFRGAFITGRVLGINPGTPNPAFLNMTPPTGNYTTERQAIEALVMNQPCQSCHGTYINPPGFVLEHYNSVGTWQDTDPLGGTIDGTADVYFNSGDTETISSPSQLMTKLSTLSNAQYTYAQNWVSYATGRVANANDACTVDTLSGNLAGSSYTIANMMADYTQADSFSQRTMGN